MRLAIQPVQFPPKPGAIGLAACTNLGRRLGMSKIGTESATHIHDFNSVIRKSFLRRSTGLVGVLAVSLTLAACQATNLGVNIADQTAATDTAVASGQDSLMAMANQMAGDGNHAGAIPLYRQAVRKHPGDAAPHTGLARSLIAIGEYGEANNILRRAASKVDKAGGGEHFELLAESYLVLGDLQAADINYREAMSRGHHSPSGYSGLGVTMDALGRHERALGAFESGLDRFPNDPNLALNYALSKVLGGDAGGGVEGLEALAVSSDTSSEVRQNLALAYTFNGEYEKAFQMASIDLDTESARRTVAGYERLSLLPNAQRMNAVLYGMANPETDYTEPANHVFGDGDGERKAAAAERVVLEPEPPEPEVPVVVPEEPKPELPDIPPLVEPEGWSVQIAAYRDIEDLMPGWRQLSARYGNIFGAHEPRRSEVDFGDRTEEPSGFFYRLNVGPLSGLEESLSICEQVLRLDGECWVRPPEPAEGRLPDDNS